MPILQALAPGAVIDCFIMGISVILLALGRTREFLSYRVLATVLAVVAFFLGVHWGPLGVAIGVSISRLFAGIVCAKLCSSCSESPVRWADMHRAAIAPFLAALAAGVAITILDRSICSTSNQYANLFLSGATFGLLYLCAWAVQPGQVKAIRTILAMSFKKQTSAAQTDQTDTVLNGDADKSAVEELVLK